MGRELHGPSQFRVLTKDLIRCGSGEKEDVENAGLGDPVSLGRLFSGMNDIDPGFRSDGDEDCDSRIRRVCVDHGNRSI